MAAVTGAVIAGAGLVNGVVQSNRARGDARSAQRAQEAAQQQQVELAREQMAEGNRRYAQWESMFMPGFSALRDAAFEEVRPDFDAITSDIGNAFDSARDSNLRSMQRFGIKPGDGAMQSADTQYGLGRALATVQGRNSARRTARNEQWNRLAGYTNAGNALYAGSNQMISAAYDGLSSAFGGQASAANQSWQIGNQNANGWMQDAAGWAGWGANQWMNRPGAGASAGGGTGGGGASGGWGAFGPGGGNWTLPPGGG